MGMLVVDGNDKDDDNDDDGVIIMPNLQERKVAPMLFLPPECRKWWDTRTKNSNAISLQTPDKAEAASRCIVHRVINVRALARLSWRPCYLTWFVCHISNRNTSIPFASFPIFMVHNKVESLWLKEINVNKSGGRRISWGCSLAWSQSQSLSLGWSRVIVNGLKGKALSFSCSSLVMENDSKRSLQASYEQQRRRRH